MTLPFQLCCLQQIWLSQAISTVHVALFGRYPKVLALLASWDLYCSEDVACKASQYSILMPFCPLRAFMKGFLRERVYDAFTLVSFMLLKQSLHWQQCQVQLPVWDSWKGSGLLESHWQQSFYLVVLLQQKIPWALLHNMETFCAEHYLLGTFHIILVYTSSLFSGIHLFNDYRLT